MRYLILQVIEKFAVSLLMTLALESLAAWLWEIRSKKAYKVLWTVNLLTNPVAVMICWGFQLLFPALPAEVYQLPVEVMAVLAEGYIYKSFSEEKLFRKPFWFSVFANAISYSCGCIVMLGKGGIL